MDNNELIEKLNRHRPDFSKLTYYFRCDDVPTLTDCNDLMTHEPVQLKAADLLYLFEYQEKQIEHLKRVYENAKKPPLIINGTPDPNAEQAADDPADDFMNAFRDMIKNSIAIMEQSAANWKAYLQTDDGKETESFYRQLSDLEITMIDMIESDPVKYNFVKLYELLSEFDRHGNALYTFSIPAFNTFIDDAIEYKQRNKRTHKKEAAEAGAVTRIDNLMYPSAMEYRNALTSIRLFKMPVKGADNMFRNDGQLIPIDLSMLSNDIESDKMLLGAFFFAAKKQYDAGHDDDIIEIYLTSFFDDLKIDPRKALTERADDTRTQKEIRRDYMLQRLNTFDQTVGQTPNGSLYRVLAFVQYDAESEMMQITAPYLYRIIERTEQRHQRQLIEEKRPRKHPEYNNLFHADAANERNAAALEIAVRLTNGLLEQGKHVKKYEIKCSTLINDCPELKYKLERIQQENKNPAQAKNQAIKQAFVRANKILKRKTDLFEVYKDLKIEILDNDWTKKAPTMSTLENKIVITHDGLTKDAKEKEAAEKAKTKNSKKS